MLVIIMYICYVFLVSFYLSLIYKLTLYKLTLFMSDLHHVHEHARGTRAIYIARTHAAHMCTQAYPTKRCRRRNGTVPVGVLARRRIACRRNGTKPYIYTYKIFWHFRQFPMFNLWVRPLSDPSIRMKSWGGGGGE